MGRLSSEARTRLRAADADDEGYVYGVHRRIVAALLDDLDEAERERVELHAALRKEHNAAVAPDATRSRFLGVEVARLLVEIVALDGEDGGPFDEDIVGTDAPDLSDMARRASAILDRVKGGAT